jgi:hypothetical protein
MDLKKDILDLKEKYKASILEEVSLHKCFMVYPQGANQMEIIIKFKPYMYSVCMDLLTKEEIVSLIQENCKGDVKVVRVEQNRDGYYVVVHVNMN